MGVGLARGHWSLPFVGRTVGIPWHERGGRDELARGTAGQFGLLDVGVGGSAPAGEKVSEGVQDSASSCRGVNRRSDGAVVEGGSTTY